MMGRKLKIAEAMAEKNHKSHSCFHDSAVGKVTSSLIKASPVPDRAEFPPLMEDMPRMKDALIFHATASHHRHLLC